MLIISFLLFHHFFIIDSYDRGPHGLNVIVEKFQFGDYYFIFYTKSVNWAEAYTICEATGSRLAVINTLEKAKFLAKALSQTKVGFEDVWIGGRLLKDNWQWAPISKLFTPPKNKFPPWLHYPTHRGKNCLALDRRNHWDPIFVELRCYLYRPFICEESVSGSIDTYPKTSSEIQIDDRRYYLYYGRLTWAEALTFCKQTDTRLAIISDLQTANMLANSMKRARPSIENVWIGGHKEILGWTWVATYQVFPNETQRNGYPPWKIDSPSASSKACLMLDHHPCLNSYRIFQSHVCEKAVFLEDYCILKKDFLCESISKKTDRKNTTTLVKGDQITYVFNKEKLSWIDASLSCKSINMTLAMPETSRQWQTILIHMDDLQFEIDHLWLGGHWRGNDWVWLNDHSIPLPKSNETYPPWCLNPEIPLHEDEEDCLNLDRDAHNIPLIYGYNCSVLQSYVCQLNAEDFLNTSPTIIDEYQINYNALAYFEAEFKCRSNQSYLAIINNIELSQKVALQLSRNQSFWVGARRIDGVWRWTKTKQAIPDETGPDGYPPWESFSSNLGGTMCLVVKSIFREQPHFIEMPCENKLPFICEFERKQLPQPDFILELHNIKYYFYKKKLTWNEAMAMCTSGGLFLANVGNLELAEFLIEVMKDSNPQWTSGKQLTAGSWAWSTNGFELSNEIKSGYPPWLKGTIPNDQKSGCLLLESVDNNPIFTGRNCLENHSFVCIDKIPMHNETNVIINNFTITLQDTISSIIKAKQQCLENGKKLIDFSKVDPAKLILLMKTEKVKSLWVDVILNEKGRWVYADTQKLFKTDFEFSDRDIHSTNDQRACLVLQLTQNQTFILVPSFCSDFSRIICMSSEDKKQAPPMMEKIINESLTLTAIYEPNDISQVNLICNDKASDVVQKELLGTVIDFFKTLPEEYDKFWLEARFVNASWQWKDGTLVQMETPYVLPQKSTIGQNCLIYNRKLDKLVAVNCFKKYTTVCQKVVALCPPKSNSDLVEWFPTECSKQRQISGAVCRAKCPPDMSLFGFEYHTCSRGMWSSSAQLKCQVPKRQALLLNILHRNLTQGNAKSFFLFIIDIGIKKFEFIKVLTFVKYLGNTVLLSTNRKVSIELYSYNAKTIDLMENNNCYFMHTLEELGDRPRMSNNLANYMNAFVTAEQEFLDKYGTPNINFLFFFVMRPDSGPLNRTVVIQRLKNMGVTIIVVALGNLINRNQLEEIASVKFGALQLYTFNTIKDLQQASYFLKDRSRVHFLDCPRSSNRFG